MENRKDLQAKLQKMSQEELIDMMIEKEKILIEKEKVQAELDWYKEQFSLLKKARYGSSLSEKIPAAQLNLFNEAEDLQDHPVQEIETTVKKVKRKKTKEMDLSKLPRKIIEHKLENTHCEVCGEEMKELAPEIIDVLKYQPARYYVERHIVHQYICKHCSDEINEEGEIKAKIVSADKPQRLIKGSLASASVVAGIAFNKYVSGTPLYRQEQELKRKGVPITRMNMSGWLMRCAADYLSPLYEIMKQDIRTCKYVHMDETTVTVLEEKSERTSKNYMWVAGSGKWEEKQMAMYYYHKNREHEFAQKIIGSDYSGNIHRDGYEAYDKILNAGQFGCMAHFRRYIYEAYELDQGSRIKNKEELESYAKTHESFRSISHILKEIRYFFDCEARYNEEKLTPEEIYQRRQEEQKQRLDELFVYLNEIEGKFPKQSKASKAIQYGLNQKEKLKNYLNDGYAEISNNRGERMVKPFVMGRKAWLFSNTISGAESSSIYYSLIESAKLNQLDIHKYLEYVLEELSKIEMPTEEDYRRYLPYSEQLPAELKVK